MKKSKIYQVKVKISKSPEKKADGLYVTFKNEFLNGVVFFAKNPTEAKEKARVIFANSDDVKKQNLTVEVVGVKLVKTDFVIKD